MEGREEEENMNKFASQKCSGLRKGGLRTMPFIIVNESLERVASTGLMPNMIFYLLSNYHMTPASGSILLGLWSSLSNALAIFGAFISDSYLGRFSVIALGSLSSLLGMTLLWLTTVITQLKPPPCDQFDQECSSATPAQLAVLFSSFGLMSIGAGCIRPCSIAFGADQLENKGNPSNKRLLESFFNWYYASVSLASVVSLTVIVYIQDHMGWKAGFGVPVILMLFSTLMFLVGFSLYVKVNASTSLFTGIFQVLVVAFKNRNLNLPHSNFDQYHHNHDTKLDAPTANLSFLNKACLVRDLESDLNPDGSASNPWALCTVEQVEFLKSLIKVIPMWSTGFMMLVCLNQHSFATLQASTMDRHITQSFEIPAASFNVFMIVTITIWVAFYDRVMVPLLAKYTGQPQGLSAKVRMGIGIILTCAAMAVSAITENIRRRIAIQEGLEDQPNAVLHISAMWLVPQYVLLGLAEGFNAVGQIEFYYSQFPKSMSSLAMALFTLGMAVASLVGTLLIDIVESVTSEGGKESWLSTNLNKGHLDYYYWLVTLLASINFIYYLICCWAYGPLIDEREKLSDKIEEDQFDYRDLPSS